MTEGLRRVKGVPLPGVDLAKEVGQPPQVELVDPASLLVDEAYQRHLSERSMRLVRKVAGGWDWRKFKPPIVARVGEDLKVIDGQHTATAAASHPGVKLIPVMVVEAGDVRAQAAAFVGHNRDRLGLTQTQLHHAAVAAGDPEALAIDAACREAGAKMIKNTPGNGVFEPRMTMAVGSISQLVKRRGHEKAVAVLKVLADAELAPIAAQQIKAVELLLCEDEYAEVLDPADLTTTLIRMGSEADRDAAVFASAHNLQIWRGLAVVLFKNTRHGRRRKA